MLGLQKQSRYLANKHLRKCALDSLNKKRIPKGYKLRKALSDDEIYSLFEDSTNLSLLNLGILNVTNKKVYVDESWILFGGSQATAAKKAAKSIRTINRRLKGVSKLSVAQSHPDNLTIYKELQFSDKEEWKTKANKYFIKNGCCYEHLVSLYKPTLHLFNCKKLRKKLNRFWTKMTQLTLEVSQLSQSTSEVSQLSQPTSEVSQLSQISFEVSQLSQISFEVSLVQKEFESLVSQPPQEFSEV